MTKLIADSRILRIEMINLVSGELVTTVAGDATQDEAGVVKVVGLWGDLVPFAKEDHAMMAADLGISPLEWLYRRLLTCPMIAVEIVE